MGIKEERVLALDPKGKSAERLLKRLGVAIKTFGLYPQDHPVADRALQGFLAVLRPYFETYGALVARIGKHGFTIDGTPYEGESYTSLALHLYTRKLAMLTVLPAATDQEVAAFLSVVGMDRISLETAGGVEHLLWQAGVGNVQVIELTLDEEQDVEALGLNAFLALIGRGRLAPREREAVIDILYSAEQTARLLQNVYLMAAEVFEGITPEEQVHHTYLAVRTLDRLVLDEPLEGQAPLYTNLAEALVQVDDPPGPALPRAIIAQAGEDATAKFLLNQLPPERLAEMVARALRPEEAAGSLTGLLRALALPEQKAEALVAVLDARLRPPEAPPNWLLEAVRPALRTPGEARHAEVPPEFVFDDSLVVINHEDLAQRLKESKGIDEAAAIREVIVTLIDVLRDETEEQELLEVADGLAGYLTWMVDRQEFSLLAGVLERLKRVAAADGGTRSALAGGIVKRMTEHPLLDRLLAALWAGRETPVESEVRACLEVLAEDVLTPLVRVLGGEPRAGMRAVLCDLLVAISREHVAELGSFVTDERWYLVRNIANILGRLQQPEAVSYLERVIGHHEYRVRREVADALARLGTEQAQSLLVRLLDDPDQRIQLRAVQALNAWGTRQALPRLLAMVEAPDPLHRLFSLKAAALEALERLGAREAIPVLRRLARKFFVLGRHRRELRALARRALAAIEGQAPEPERPTPTVQAH